MLEEINFSWVAWLSGCALLIPDTARVHSARQSNNGMVRLTKFCRLHAGHIQTCQNKLCNRLRWRNHAVHLSHSVWGSPRQKVCDERTGYQMQDQHEGVRPGRIGYAPQYSQWCIQVWAPLGIKHKANLKPLQLKGPGHQGRGHSGFRVKGGSMPGRGHHGVSGHGFGGYRGRNQNAKIFKNFT